MTKWSLVGVNTAGTTTQAISNNIIYFSGDNSMTLSGNGSTIVFLPDPDIAGIAGSGTSTVTSRNVQFGNANSVSFGLNGSTMTASVSGLHTHGTIGLWEPLPILNTGVIQSNGTLFIYPITQNINISASRAEFVVSVQQSVNATLKNQGNLSLGVLIYTSSNDGYRLATVSSGTTVFTNNSIGSGSSTNSVSYTGVIKYSVPINVNMTPGLYGSGYGLDQQ